ncbi:DUF5808 domain-containing protein [Flavobacterium sp. WC2409]|uniref:DUF5808 domain-containing protein n=1 Tax=Flavobacterium sp. WC2409 TaxID=3234139 RepID=A0AB39W583_9FLAO
MNPEDKPTKETLNKWHKDPKNWKLGVFYYNKEDKRILPPKRMAWVGWTVNFANSISVALFVITIIIIISLALFSSK